MMIGPNPDKTTFKWLRYFRGREMRCLSNEGHYISLRDKLALRPVLSSIAPKNTPLYVPADNLAGHVGHSVWIESEDKKVFIRCRDCNTIMASLTFNEKEYF